jgi:hypothetical protein
MQGQLFQLVTQLRNLLQQLAVQPTAALLRHNELRQLRRHGTKGLSPAVPLVDVSLVCRKALKFGLNHFLSLF